MSAPVKVVLYGDAEPTDAYNASLGARGDSLHTNFTFGAFDTTKAPSYDRWPSGLLNRTTGYVAGMRGWHNDRCMFTTNVVLPVIFP